MKCVKCGKEITKDDAYCNNCGTINLDCDKNKILQDMLEDKNYQYELNDLWHNKLFRYLDNSKKMLVLFNVILFVFSFPFFKYLFDIGDKYNLLLLSSTLIINFYILCLEIILKKAGMHWWGMFIPFYNFYLLFKLCFGNGYLSIILIFSIMFFYVSIDLLPALGMYFLAPFSIYIILIEMLTLFFMLGKRFKRSGIITMLFFYVIIPSIAFSKRYVYNNKYKY